MALIQKILKYRGYNTLKEYNQHLIMKDKEDNIIIVFMNNDDLNISILKSYLEILETSNVKHAIIVYENKITPSSKKILASISHFYRIELFTFKEMSFDIQQHKYYFPHIKLNKEERQEIVEKFGVKIPTILETDPVIRFLGYRKGDIVKVIRKDNYISYRIVK